MPINVLKQLLTFDLHEQDLVFDMDGTLLQGDLGETVFYLTLIASHLGIQIADFESLYPAILEAGKFDMKPSDPVADILFQYSELRDSGAVADAYRLTAAYFDELNQNHLSCLAQTFLKRDLPPVTKTVWIDGKILKLDFFARADPIMVEFLQQITRKKARIWIISGSPQQVVHTFCRTYRIPTVHAYGVHRQKDGTYFVPYQKTKVILLEKHGVKKPFLVAGNSKGDLDMFGIGSNILVRSDSSDGLLNLAQQNNWFVV